MTARRRRLPAGIALAFLVVGLALPATASEAMAAAATLSITVHVGYHDVIKFQQWMPVSIDVKNSGSAVDGTLEVQATFSAQPGVPGPAIYEMPISLAAGAAKHVRTYVVEDSPGESVGVRIVSGGRVLASQTAATTNSDTALVGVVSDQSTALDDFAAIHPGGIAAGVVHLTTEDLVDSAIVLRGFDLLVFDDFATDSLTAAQRTAIADYVQTGGSLLIGTGASWRKTLAGLPAGIMPMQPTGSTTLASSQALGGLSGIEVATGSLSSGIAWLSEGDQPLLAERTFGSGSVTMATFDWNQEPISGWSGTRPLLRQIMVRTILGTQSNPNFAMATGPFGAQGSSVAQRSNVLSNALGNLPSLDLPSLALTGTLVLIYVLLVGPINYFILRAMHRRALAWITVPLIAIIAAGGAYGGGLLTKGRSVQTNQVSVIHLEPGSDRAYQETYTGVLTPTRGDYQVSTGQSGLLISPIGSYGGGFGGPNPGVIRVNVDSGSVSLPGMTAFTLRGFATEGLTAAPRLTGSVRLINGKVVGTVQNLSSTRFTDAVVIAGDGYQTFGALAPGATATINLTPKVGNSFAGPPAYMSIYPNYSFGPQPNQPTDAMREGDAKTQILSLLPIGASFKGITPATIPIFVAWTKQASQDITVSGAHPRSYAEAAVVLTLPVEQVSAGALPAGVVTGRIVDIEGDTQPGPPGGVFLQNGTVTYDFTPGLAAGTHLSGATLSSSNPFGAKGFAPGANGSSPTLQGAVWDWSQSAWVDLSYHDNGTTTVPDAGINPTSGEMRLRLTATNGGYMSGGISLTGTIT